MRPAARHGGVCMQMDFLKRNENQAGIGDRAGAMEPEEHPVRSATRARIGGC